MKVIVKKPGVDPEVCELNSISEINGLVGNVDENGNGWNETRGETCDCFSEGIHIHMNQFALINPYLEQNIKLPAHLNSKICGGTVVFTGYDDSVIGREDTCSLNQEQIDYCLQYIKKQSLK